jgi:hypothetical protein
MAIGYFLAQHKRQFGGNKRVSGITVYRNTEDNGFPNAIFWVAEGAAGENVTIDEAGFEKRHVLREHYSLGLRL